MKVFKPNQLAPTHPGHDGAQCHIINTGRPLRLTPTGVSRARALSLEFGIMTAGDMSAQRWVGGKDLPASADFKP